MREAVQDRQPAGAPVAASAGPLPSRPARYLIVPMQPTPNGRMHIGHAAGAYLRADVLARHLRRAGHEAAVISGSDAYENWILLDALQNDRGAAETCWRFHALIRDDLARLGVDLDEWISPLDDDHEEGYRSLHEQMVTHLSDRGEAVRIAERVPRSTGSGRYVVGVWLVGRCPQCGGEGGGNACERCGYHYQPADILDPRSRLDEGPLEWVTFDSWYLRPRAPRQLIQAVQAADVAPEFAEIATTYIAQTGGLARLSQPGPWGIASELAGPGGVLSNPYYSFSLYCGEVYRQRHGLEHSPFDRDSEVITIGLFGIDNAIGGVAVSTALAQAHGGLRAFDHMITNHFLTFEGAKCSTSRRHGIWLHELLGAATSVSGDELRYYLAQTRLEHGADDFTVGGFVAATTALRRWMAQAASARRVPATDVSAQARVRIARAVSEQARWLAPGSGFTLSGATAVLDDWVTRRADLRQPDGADTAWLLGLALLAEPIMPGFAGGLWTSLGLPGRPALAQLDRRPAPPATRPSAPPVALDPAEVARVARTAGDHA